MYRPASALYTAPPSPDFGAYVDGAREHLQRHAVAVEGFERARQIEWRLPFERLPADHCPANERVGLLLIHGLADTPAVFERLGERLAQECVHVRAILLPGHGTRPGDLVTAESHHWLAAARTHAKAFADEVDRLYIGGHSLGATIATSIAGEIDRIEGLVALAPAWQLKGFDLALWAATLAEPFIDFAELEREINPLKYETLATNVGDEVRELTASVQDELATDPRFSQMPALVAASAADSVIDLDAAQRIFRQRFAGPRSRLIVYRDANHPVPEWWEPKRMVEKNGYIPSLRILEISHQAIPVGAEHTLYGPGAPLQHCLEPNGISRATCLARPKENIWYGAYRGEDERDPERMTARLTWNPHFEDLAQRIASFLRPARAPDRP